MAWYLVEIRYVQEKYREIRPRHREYLAELADRGAVAVAGPLADDTGGVILLEAADEQALNAILEADPYHREAALESRTVREIKPTLGAWLPE